MRASGPPHAWPAAAAWHEVMRLCFCLVSQVLVVTDARPGPVVDGTMWLGGEGSELQLGPLRRVRTAHGYGNGGTFLPSFFPSLIPFPSLSLPNLLLPALSPPPP